MCVGGEGSGSAVGSKRRLSGEGSQHGDSRSSSSSFFPTDFMGVHESIHNFEKRK